MGSGKICYKEWLYPNLSLTGLQCHLCPHMCTWNITHSQGISYRTNSCSTTTDSYQHFSPWIPVLFLLWGKIPDWKKVFFVFFFKNRRLSSSLSKALCFPRVLKGLTWTMKNLHNILLLYRAIQQYLQLSCLRPLRWDIWWHFIQLFRFRPSNLGKKSGQKVIPNQSIPWKISQPMPETFVW